MLAVAKFNIWESPYGGVRVSIHFTESIVIKPPRFPPYSPASVVIVETSRRRSTVRPIHPLAGCGKTPKVCNEAAQNASKMHARNRSAAESRVQLHFPGAAGPQRPSAAAHPHDGGRNPEAAVAAIPKDVRQSGAARRSIPPEQLLRAQLLQMLYSVRSERLLMEEMDYNILFRWFVGLNLDDPVWDATVFTKNRDRLLEAEVAKEFLARVVGQARAADGLRTSTSVWTARCWKRGPA